MRNGDKQGDMYVHGGERVGQGTPQLRRMKTKGRGRRRREGLFIVGRAAGLGSTAAIWPVGSRRRGRGSIAGRRGIVRLGQG